VWGIPATQAVEVLDQGEESGSPAMPRRSKGSKLDADVVGQICEPIDIFPTAGPFAFLASSVFPDATSRNAGSTKARAFCCAVGDAQVKVCGGVCAGIGGRRARMMGCDFDASCECCARSFEVVERSTASLNSFTSFGEAVARKLRRPREAGGMKQNRGRAH
jgi:hypothetical protein